MERRNRYALVGSVALSILLLSAATVEARTSAAGSSGTASRCKSQNHLKRQASTISPVAREAELLRGLMSQGWQLTSEGRAVLGGALPAPVAASALAPGDSAIRSEQSAQLAYAPKGWTASSFSPAVRSTQSAKRANGEIPVFLACGINQSAYVNFYVVPSSLAWVRWQLNNFATGASKIIRSANSNVCPGNSGGCLEFFNVTPNAPWEVWAAYENSSNGFPEPIQAYCQPS